MICRAEAWKPCDFSSVWRKNQRMTWEVSHRVQGITFPSLKRRKRKTNPKFSSSTSFLQGSLISFPVPTRIPAFLKTPAQMQCQMWCSDKAGNNLHSPAGRRSNLVLLFARKSQCCYKNSAQMRKLSLYHSSSLSMWRWTYLNQQSSESNECLAW